MEVCIGHNLQVIDSYGNIATGINNSGLGNAIPTVLSKYRHPCGSTSYVNIRNLTCISTTDSAIRIIASTTCRSQSRASSANMCQTKRSNLINIKVEKVQDKCDDNDKNSRVKVCRMNATSVKAKGRAENM